MESVINLSELSWISVATLPKELLQQYDERWVELWNLRNEWKGSKVITGGITRESPRIHASFGVVPSYKGTEPSYMFSGSDGICAKGSTHPIPNLLKELVDHFNNHTSGGHYNEVTLNWYEDGNNYTAQHADYMEGMVESLPIVIVTFCPEGSMEQGNLRQFLVRSKDEHILHGDGTTEGVSDGRFARPDRAASDTSKKLSLRYFDNLALPTYHGQIIRMGGKTQEEFRHGIPKYSADPTKCAPRVSVTLRAYKIL